MIANKRINYPKNRKPRPYKVFECELCYTSFKSRYNGIRHYCNSCKVVAQRIRAAKWWSEHKEEFTDIRRERNLQRRYGLSVNDYGAMFKGQQGCCAICGKRQSDLGKRLHVDHNHETKAIRGLLCTGCNTVLGRLEKNWNEIMKYLSVGFIGNRSL